MRMFPENGKCLTNQGMGSDGQNRLKRRIYGSTPSLLCIKTIPLLRTPRCCVPYVTPFSNECGAKSVLKVDAIRFRAIEQHGDWFSLLPGWPWILDFSWNALRKHRVLLRNYLQQLGFVINWGKSVLNPKKSIWIPRLGLPHIIHGDHPANTKDCQGESTYSTSIGEDPLMSMDSHHHLAIKNQFIS